MNEVLTIEGLGWLGCSLGWENYDDLNKSPPWVMDSRGEPPQITLFQVDDSNSAWWIIIIIEPVNMYHLFPTVLESPKNGEIQMMSTWKVMAQSPVKNDLSAQQLHRVKEQCLGRAMELFTFPRCLVIFCRSIIYIYNYIYIHYSTYIIIYMYIPYIWKKHIQYIYIYIKYIYIYTYIYIYIYTYIYIYIYIYMIYIYIYISNTYTCI